MNSGIVKTEKRELAPNLDSSKRKANGRGRSFKFTAIMRWVEPNQQWFMYNAANNKFIMNFFDCENITRLFPCMRKDRENKYELAIKHL